MCHRPSSSQDRDGDADGYDNMGSLAHGTGVSKVNNPAKPALDSRVSPVTQ